jgi:hypothetical protein
MKVGFQIKEILKKIFVKVFYYLVKLYSKLMHISISATFIRYA